MPSGGKSGTRPSPISVRPGQRPPTARPTGKLWRVSNRRSEPSPIFTRVAKQSRRGSIFGWSFAIRSSRSRSEERRVGKGVDLGGRRIIKKKKKKDNRARKEV